MTSNSDVPAWVERSVLGACLRHADTLADVCEVLTPDDFTSYAHRQIFVAVQTLWLTRSTVDCVAVATSLRSAGQLDEVTPVYLADLYEQAGSGANVGYHARQIRDASLLRRMAATCEAAACRCQRPDGSAEEILGAVERDVLAVNAIVQRGEVVPLGVAVDEAFRRLDARIRGEQGAGLPTGFDAVDQILGGLQPSELVVVAARPSVGKTAWGFAVALNASRYGTPTLFFSLEQSRVELGDRYLVSQAGVDSRSLRIASLTRDEQGRLVAVRAKAHEATLWIDDGAHTSVARIASVSRRRRDQDALGLVVVDYLGLVDPEDRSVPRHEQVGTIARRVKGLARELKVPVVLLAQLNREVEARSGQRPRLADLRDSGEVEQHADTVLLLHRPTEDDGDAVRRTVIVAKNRNGPTGDAELTFRRDVMRFESRQSAEVFA